MYLAIITLPLLGSIVSGFFGRKVGVSGAQLITSTCVIVTTLLAIVAFFEVGLNNIPVSINLFRWIDSESLNVIWGFHFDSLTVAMLIPVLIVSSLVHIYSIGYMSHDPHNQRFFSYLSLFTFMMIILVTANNFLLMFVGWEGVGICSYLLVNFWFTRIAANQSAISALLTNRVGDCFLTIGMFTILWSFGNIDYSTVFSLAPFVNQDVVTIIGICLLIGAMAKSSQVGLHVWLPMAMEGPTPVSALIHAATMVTAGVYLLMRASPLIEYSSTVLILCLWIGAFTTVFSSLIGLFQQDIKKVIAYSTMSQKAREYINIFRHQTIYEKIIYNIKYNIHTTLFFFRCTQKERFKVLYEKTKLVFEEMLHKARVDDLNSIFCPRQDSQARIEDREIKINPYYVTGFADGESCFLINIIARSDCNRGYHISLTFKIKLHSNDSAFLENIRNYFDKKGTIYIIKEGYIDYIVSSIKDLEVFINHFEKYPLISQKLSDYVLFKQVFYLIKYKQHLTMSGLTKTLFIKAVLNHGLSDALKVAFPDIIPNIRPRVLNPRISEPDWVSGFVEAEGYLFVTLINNSKGVALIFKVTQDKRDEKLLKSLVDYFKCGRYYTCLSNAADYIVTKFDDINTKIIPFLKKYSTLGDKGLYFASFKHVAGLMENKTYLTSEGLKEIKLLKSNAPWINKGRLNRQLAYSSRIISYTSVVRSGQPVGLGNRYYSTKVNKGNCNNSLFNEWFAGLIDGRGEFILSKKGYASFKIIMSISDKSALYKIKHKYGGSIKSIAGSNSLRYKLHNKKGLMNLIKDVNGLIRNPTRLLKLYRICLLYNIKLHEPKALTYNNGWFSGFIDADGSIYINEQSGQLSISVTQKNKFLLDPLIRLYSGRVQPILSKEAFQYSIYKKEEVLNLLDNYLSKYPLRSVKIHKLNLIKLFYTFKPYMHLDMHQIDKYNEWIKFKNQWDKL
jgi:NADH:ubiquinone oxidoreductase subunit 2 (subunit N)